MKLQLRLLLIPLGIVGLFVLMVGAEQRPYLFANETYLGALIALEVVLACMWRFEKLFVPVTAACFLVAGTGLPLSGESTTLRWLFLAVGALAGLVLWMKSNRAQHFGVFHLVGLFCIFAAAASASGSDAPGTALLKVLGLFLLFLFAATGARVALAGREGSFVHGLVLACEILVYITSACYFVLRYELFGSPNALGAIIGVVITPILLWAALVAEGQKLRRRYVALALCGGLLYVSVCRAAILADAVLVVLLTIVLRRPRLLVKAAFVGALFLEVMAVANPSHMSQLVDSFSGRFIFKDTQENSHPGVFGSRQTPWEDTVSAVKQHPWFGTGFGTSESGDQAYIPGSIVSDQGTNREHGSSYLALAEYLGLLGIAPFLLLLLLLTRSTARVFTWMRNGGGPYHYAVPFAMVAAAGLIHAGFEDWLFAAGSYLCVFFWLAAFLLIDLASSLKADLPIAALQPAAPLAQPLALQHPTT
jgi:O-antigen ligase